jgi:predicted nucleic acid-binding protein
MDIVLDTNVIVSGLLASFAPSGALKAASDDCRRVNRKN